MKISKQGLELIKKYEGFKGKRYLCPAGKWTIGYGHVLRNGEDFEEINELQAEELLRQDIIHAENAVNSYVQVKITQGQFDALVSLTFNWGANNFLHSKGLSKLNEMDYDGAIKEFMEVNKVKGVIMAGLAKRRDEESKLFYT